MPFSTALYSYFVGHDGAFMFYCFNLAAIGFMSYAMAVYVVRKESLAEQFGKMQSRWMKNRILMDPLVFLLCVPIMWFSPDWVASPFS